jgi:hypothetical protein
VCHVAVGEGGADLRSQVARARTPCCRVGTVLPYRHALCLRFEQRMCVGIMVGWWNAPTCSLPGWATRAMRGWCRRQSPSPLAGAPIMLPRCAACACAWEAAARLMPLTAALPIHVIHRPGTRGCWWRITTKKAAGWDRPGAIGAMGFCCHTVVLEVNNWSVHHGFNVRQVSAVVEVANPNTQ